MSDRPQTATGFTKTQYLPPSLRQHGKFCLWKYEERTSNGKTRWTKMPYQPRNPQYGADSTNPASFSSLEMAAGRRGDFDGLGVGIFDGLCAIDIDHCRNKETGEVSPAALKIIDTMSSYTEVSPSGTGVRILFKAQGVNYDRDRFYINKQNAIPASDEWPEQQGLEVYIEGMTNKFVTVTGAPLREIEIAERGEQVLQVVHTYMKRETAPKTTTAAAAAPVYLNDQDILEKAFKATNGGRISALYSGDITGYPSQSEADLALMSHLAFYTGGDKEQMIRIFKTSGLANDRKGSDRNTMKYLEKTAQKAINNMGNAYDPNYTSGINCANYTNSITDTRETTKAPAPEEEAPEIRTPTDSTGEIDAFMHKVQTRAYEPISTGAAGFDYILNGGLYRQTLVTLGAAPGAGKTLLAQQIFEGMAKEGKASCLYFNLEMSTEQLIARSLSRETGIETTAVLQGYRWTDEQAAKITVAAQKYKATIAPHIAYNPPDSTGRRGSAYFEDMLDAMDAEAAAREQAPLVVVDYLQLLQSRITHDDVETIKAALKAFKDWAIRNNSIVFLIMAHSRTINEKGIATQGAGRDTSAIEYSGDIQLSLNYSAVVDGKYSNMDAMRKAIEDPDDPATPDLYARRVVVCTKNRFGEDRRRLYMYFDGQHSRFDMFDTEHTDPRPAARRF